MSSDPVFFVKINGLFILILKIGNSVQTYVCKIFQLLPWSAGGGVGVPHCNRRGTWPWLHGRQHNLEVTMHLVYKVLCLLGPPCPLTHRQTAAGWLVPIYAMAVEKGTTVDKVPLNLGQCKLRDGQVDEPCCLELVRGPISKGERSIQQY